MLPNSLSVGKNHTSVCGGGADLSPLMMSAFPLDTHSAIDFLAQEES